MDLSESFFTRYSGWRRKKEKEKENFEAAYFEEEIKSIQLFFSLMCPEKDMFFRKSDGIGTVTRDIVFLPEKITFFNNKNHNRKVYLHKALVAGVIYKNQLRYLKGWTEKKQRSFQIWALQDLLRAYLSHELSSYDSFFKDLFQAIEKGDYKKEKNDNVFASWVIKSKPLSLEQVEGDIKESLVDLYRQCGDLHTKRLMYYPMAELMLYCGLLTSSQSVLSMPYDSKGRTSKGAETEAEGKNISSTDLKVVDLDKKKEQENPIMHSFETLHTADEYQGGYRVSDASDEMADHQNALEELHLESVTRSGDQASSVYRAFIDGFIEMLDASKHHSKDLPFKTYPEWDYKLGALKKDHCRLYFSDRYKESTAEGGSEWVRGLKEKYSTEVYQWKKRIESIVNSEVWINRQWSGEDIDIESYIDFCSDIKRGNVKETPLYVNHKKENLDTACLLLLDQSFSTDSWVQNKRVLDIELEAIGLTGLLTSSFMDSVAVAGTWSETRNHCYFSLYKDFSENWSAFNQQSPEIAPQGYTRLGPAIRHSIEKLCSIKARQRMLIILTDGKPTDYDRYEGRYGIEDVRNAIFMAEKSGIFTNALAIDKMNSAHLSQIFGEGKYTVLNDIRKFPESLLMTCLQAIRR